MTTRTLQVDALAPLLFRDGRPFGASSDESRAHGMQVPLPSTVAGFVRTMIGQHNGWNWSSPEVIARAQSIEVSGQLIAYADGSGPPQAAFRAPRDAVVYKPPPPDGAETDAKSAVPEWQDADQRTTMRLVPDELPVGAGCDLPAGLRPLAITADVKPDADSPWWLWSDLEQWLLGQNVVPRKLAGPPMDERVHVAIDSTTRTAQEGMLFTVEYRAWEQLSRRSMQQPPEAGPPRLESWTLRLRVVSDADVSAVTLAHLGGERRPVGVRVVDDDISPRPSPALLDALTGTTRLRMMITTPALFTAGWRPGWLEGGAAEESPLAVLSGATLVSASVGRHEPVSGWNHDLRARGPKPVRRMVPAGSVYFLELPVPLSRDAVEALWLSPISDNEQDRRDGFGSTVWGVW